MLINRESSPVFSMDSGINGVATYRNDKSVYINKVEYK